MLLFIVVLGDVGAVACSKIVLFKVFLASP
jgi:hypothetical protein